LITGNSPHIICSNKTGLPLAFEAAPFASQMARQIVTKGGALNLLGGNGYLRRC
jgi:hypothetical protein